MTRAAANRLLDFVRAGGLASDADVLLALWVTGEFEMFSTQKSTPEEASLAYQRAAAIAHTHNPCAYGAVGDLFSTRGAG